MLVADDNATNRRLLADMLKGWRMNLRFAEGGRSALEMLKEASNAGNPFGLVILDANMPVLDGFAIAKRIQDDPALASATIMMLTSIGIRGDAARCNQLGVGAYLVKPVTQADSSTPSSGRWACLPATRNARTPVTRRPATKPLRERASSWRRTTR